MSGGLDSSVLLRYVQASLARTPLHAISFAYGQRHSKELHCARLQATQSDADAYRLLDISFLGELLAPGTTLVAGGDAVPDLQDLDESARNQPPTYVPNRNMMLLSMAAAYAEAQGIHELYYGAQAQDEYGYWDCTEAFLDQLNGTLALNRKESVQVHAPFLHKSKSEIVTLGAALGVDFRQTWSCYRGGDRPCQTCPTCVERGKAFEAAGMADPL